MDTSEARAALLRLMNGFQISQAIHVAAKLGIAGLLKDGPRYSDDLARETATDSVALYRLLRALAAVGVFEEQDDKKFALTPLSQHLLVAAPESIAGWATLIGQEYFWQTWGHLEQGIKTGENVFPQLHGTSVWEYRSTKPELNDTFNRAMTSNSSGVAREVVASYDFSPFRLIVDVGGNRGLLLAAILRANPNARGINFDQPHVVSAADLKAAGVADRCELVSGDFFDSVPRGGDAYVMKSIIHDWSDQDSIAILRTVRKAMRPDARLLLSSKSWRRQTRGPSPNSPT